MLDSEAVVNNTDFVSLEARQFETIHMVFTHMMVFRSIISFLHILYIPNNCPSMLHRPLNPPNPFLIDHLHFRY